MDPIERLEDVLFISEYTYTDDLISDFVDMQTDEMRGRLLLVTGLLLFTWGAGFMVQGGGSLWIGLLLIAGGVFAFWGRANLRRIMIKRCAEEMDRAASGPIGRRRFIAVTDEGLAVEAGEGPERYFSFDDLKAVQRGERAYVVVFGDRGIVVPYRSFTMGNADAFGAFVEGKLPRA